MADCEGNCSSWACLSRRAITKSLRNGYGNRADLRRLESRHRSSDADDGDSQTHGGPLWPRLSTPREAVRRHQWFRQAQQLVHGDRRRRESAQPRRFAARKRSVFGLLYRLSFSPSPIPELLRVSVAHAGERSPIGRQRSSTGHHLNFPGRSIARSVRTTRERSGSHYATWRDDGDGVSVLPRLPATPATAIVPVPSPLPAINSNFEPSEVRSRSLGRIPFSIPSWLNRSTLSRPRSKSR